MSIPYTVGTVEATERVLFRCASCNHTGPVLLRGEGHAQELGWSEASSKGALSNARSAALEDLERNEPILRCPRCGYRKPGAARQWWLERLVLPGILFIVLFVVGIALLVGAPKLRPMGGTSLVCAFLLLGGGVLAHLKQWRKFTVDHKSDRVGDALASFNNHLSGCKSCDINKGKKGLCERGKTLYAEKERRERPA